MPSPKGEKGERVACQLSHNDLGWETKRLGLPVHTDMLAALYQVREFCPAVEDGLHLAWHSHGKRS